MRCPIWVVPCTVSPAWLRARKNPGSKLSAPKRLSASWWTVIVIASCLLSPVTWLGGGILSSSLESSGGTTANGGSLSWLGRQGSAHGSHCMMNRPKANVTGHSNWNADSMQKGESMKHGTHTRKKLNVGKVLTRDELKLLPMVWSTKSGSTFNPKQFLFIFGNQQRWLVGGFNHLEKYERQWEGYSDYPIYYGK